MRRLRTRLKRGAPMNKIAGAFDAFLRVVLAVALVVTFTPISRDAAYADGVDETQSGIAASKDEGAQAPLGEQVTPTLPHSSESAANDESALSESASLSDGASSGERVVSGGTESELESAADASQAPAPPGQGLVSWAKLMPNGYIYECNSEGELLETIDEEKPSRNSVNSWAVVDLFVDRDVTSVSQSLCEGAGYLNSVTFEAGTKLDSIGDSSFGSCPSLQTVDLSGVEVGRIGDSAFAGCKRLSSVDLSGANVGEIGKRAFYGCSSLRAVKTNDTTIGAMGESCFENAGLSSTGLANVHGLTAIPKSAYEGCSNLTDTELGKNQEIQSLGEMAFAHCSSLRLSGLETNASVREVGKSCFSQSDMSGGLVLPSYSKVETLGGSAFYHTNLDYVYFQCDHAVLIDYSTFPQYQMRVMVRTPALDSYNSTEVKQDWERSNGTLPVDVSGCVSPIKVKADPSTKEYEVGDSISLRGMSVSFNYGSGEKEYEYTDLQNYAFGRFFASSPANGDLFEPDMHGTYVHVSYDDGSVSSDAYSPSALREKGNESFTVSVASEGAGPNDAVEGAGRFGQGDTCKVEARCSTPGRTFAYWKNQKGKIVSEDAAYEFEVKGDTMLIAVFLDAVTIEPEAHMDSVDGPVPQGVSFSIQANGVDHGGTFTTYVGKSYTVVCHYDNTKLSTKYWVDVVGEKTYFTDEIECTAVAGENRPICVFVERGWLDVVAKSVDGDEWGKTQGSGYYDLGSKAKIKAIPSNGGEFLGWMHRGEFIPEEFYFEYCVNDFDPVTAWFGPDVTQVVVVQAASAQPELGRVEGAGVYVQGSEVTLSAVPAAGYEFAGWLRDGKPIEGGATLSIAAEGEAINGGKVKVSPQYTAQFKRVSVEYSQVIDLGNRSVMDGVELPCVSGTLEVGEDGRVALDASALGMLDDDISFVGWYDKATGDLLSESAAYEFVPAQSEHLEARFALKDFAVRVNSAQATDASEAYARVDASTFAGYRDAGEAVQLSAVASNAHFLGWYVGAGDSARVVSDALSFEYAVEAADAREGAIDVTPKYCAEQASVVLGVDGVDEDGNPAGQFLYSGLYGIGSRATVVAIPAAGYVLDRVTDSHGNEVPVESDGSYTFLVTGDVQFIAHFRATDDGDEAFEALQAALIAALTLAGVLGTMYGLGELIDPIVVPAIAEIAAAESIEELAAIGEEALGKIKDIFDDHKKPHDPDNPDRPHGDHKIEIIAAANPQAGGSVFGGGVHYEGTVAELQAIPNPGWRFVCWMKNGVEWSTKPMTSIAVTDATPEVVNVVAVFESDVQITTSIEVEGVAADFSTGCNASPDVQLPKRGEQAAVVATEGEGYAFVGWFENGVEVSRTQTYGFVAETDRHLVAKFRKADKTIVVNVQPADAGEVLCNGMPIEGGVVRAKDGDILTFTVRANARPGDDAEKSYKFVEWRETDAAGRVVVNRQEVCEYRVDGNATLTAVMDGEDSHLVRAKASPIEGGTVALERANGLGEALEVPEGESVMAEASAADGYLFDGWYLSYGAAEAATFASNEPSYTFAPIADCTVEARFTKACKIAVVVEPLESLAGEYTVQGAGWCVAGEPATLSVELSASMREGYAFKGWYDAETGVLMGTDPSYLQFYPQEDTTVRAVFDVNRCTLEAKTESHAVKRGTVEIVGSPGASAVTVDYGTSVVLRAKPADGFQLKYWKNSAGVKFSETDLVVRATKSDTYTAVFESAKPDVVVAADSWLGGTVTCNGVKVTPTTDAFKLGETLHLAAAAYPGYVFYGWYVNGKFRSVMPEYTVVAAGAFPNPNRCSIVAAFKPLDIVCMPTADPECGGSVQASRIVTERGTDVSLKATAALGYEFVGWYDLDGKLESASAEFTCEHQQRSHIHEARFVERSYAVSASAAVADASGTLADGNAAGWVEGATTVSAGGAATLSAHAFEGYAFEYWADEQGNAVSDEPEYRFVPSCDTQLRAVFAPKQCSVSVSVDDIAGSVSGAGIYAAGQVVVLSATPKAGAKFLGWYSGGQFCSADATYRFTVRGDMALEAAFSMGECSLGVAAEPAEAGFVSGFGAYAKGERAVLSAAAKPGFTFDHWEDALGNEISELPECTVTVSGDAVYKASFTRNSYSVSLSSNVEGVGMLSGEGTYSFGQVVELNATPTNDKRFVGWQLVGDDGRLTYLSNDARCWLAIDEDLVSGLEGNAVELQAQFADPYEVAVSGAVVLKGKKTSRNCSVNGGGTFASGDQVALQAVAGIGYRFVGWSLDEAGEHIVDTNATLSFAASQDITYYAQFEADEQVKITVERSSMLRGMVRLVGHGGLETERLYDKGDMFVAVAMPWTGYRFSHWVNDAGTTVSYSAVYVGAAKQTEQLTAIFYENGYDAQTNTYPAEAALISTVIPGTGTTSVPVSTLVTIPLPGWKFKYWADENGMPVAFSPVTARPVWGNRTFTAYYEREAFDIVAVDSRVGGHIEGSLPDSEYGCVVKKTVENGASCTLCAVPDDGYAFDGWYEYGESTPKDAKPLSTDANWTFTPEGDMAIEARFAETPACEVTASAENGTVAPESVSVKPGASATFEATPNEGCYLEGVTLSSDAGEASGASSGLAEPVELDISDYAGGSYAVTLSDIAESQSLAFAFAAAGAPVVLAQPQSVSVGLGDDATLAVAADAAESVRGHVALFCGEEPAAHYGIGYQWYRAANGQGEDELLAGETNPTLGIASIGMADAGAYFCRITQEYLGTTTSVDTERATISVVNDNNFAFNGGVLESAVAHDAYSAVVPSASGGSVPYGYEVADGSELPRGLSLVASGEANGELVVRIVGIPEEAGTFDFDVTCTDGSGDERNAHFTLVVKSKAADLAFETGDFVYTGASQNPTLTGVPDGEAAFVSYRYWGIGSTRYSSAAAPTEAGTYRVVATLDHNGYIGAASATFEIAKAPVAFAIEVHDSVYDASEHAASVKATCDVAGVESGDYSVMYRGRGATAYGPTSQAPVDSGSYSVVAQATNPNMEGAAEEPFEIAKAPQAITGTTSYSAVYGDVGIAFDNVAKTPVAFEIAQPEDESASPIALRGRYATINAAGVARVVASAPESRNYLAAESVELAVAIAPAQLLVAVDDAQRMEGEANPAFTSSLVSRASTEGVEVAYSCEATEDSPAGEYAIGASVANPNFAATVKPGTLTVEKKSGPDNPEPKPDPDKPDPDAPDPGKPDPDNPDPDNPGPKPDPDNPDPGRPDPDNPDPDNPSPKPDPDPDNPGPVNPDPGKPDPDNPDPDEPGPKPDPDNPGPGEPSQPGKPSDPGNPGDPGNFGDGSGEEDDVRDGATSGDGGADADSAAKKASASANSADSAGLIAATIDRAPIVPAAALGLASLLCVVLAVRRTRYRRR